MNEFLSRFFVLAQRKYFFFISDSCCVWLLVLINISMLVIIIWSCKLIFLKNVKICLHIAGIMSMLHIKKVSNPWGWGLAWGEGGGSYWFCDWWQKLEQDSSLLSFTVQPKSMIIFLRISVYFQQTLQIMSYWLMARASLFLYRVNHHKQ